MVLLLPKQLDKKKKISGININTFMTPASNTKILTVFGSISAGDTIPSIKYRISSDTLRISPTGYPFIAHPKYDDADRAAETAAKQAKLRAARVGRSATILTSASGLDDDETSTKKTLLGG